MVAALAAERAGEHESLRAALKGGGHGDLAVGLVLGRRVGSRGAPPAIRRSAPAGVESKSPTQSSGVRPSALAWRMPPSAAITRAPARWRRSRSVGVSGPPIKMTKACLLMAQGHSVNRGRRGRGGGVFAAARRSALWRGSGRSPGGSDFFVSGLVRTVRTTVTNRSKRWAKAATSSSGQSARMLSMTPRLTACTSAISFLPSSVMTTTMRRASACEASRRRAPRATMSATMRLARDGSMRMISAIVPTVTSPSGSARRTASSTSRWVISRPGRDIVDRQAGEHPPADHQPPASHRAADRVRGSASASVVSPVVRAVECACSIGATIAKPAAVIKPEYAVGINVLLTIIC